MSHSYKVISPLHGSSPTLISIISFSRFPFHSLVFYITDLPSFILPPKTMLFLTFPSNLLYPFPTPPHPFHSNYFVLLSKSSSALLETPHLQSPATPVSSTLPSYPEPQAPPPKKNASGSTSVIPSQGSSCFPFSLQADVSELVSSLSSSPPNSSISFSFPNTSHPQILPSSRNLSLLCVCPFFFFFNFLPSF